LNSAKVKNEVFEEPIFIDFEVDLFDLSRIFTSFKDFFKNNGPMDIYSGEECIPFNHKDPEFKRVILQEFL